METITTNRHRFSLILSTYLMFRLHTNSNKIYIIYIRRVYNSEKRFSTNNLPKSRRMCVRFTEHPYAHVAIQHGYITLKWYFQSTKAHRKGGTTCPKKNKIFKIPGNSAHALKSTSLAYVESDASAQRDAIWRDIEDDRSSVTQDVIVKFSFPRSSSGIRIVLGFFCWKRKSIHLISEYSKISIELSAIYIK